MQVQQEVTSAIKELPPAERVIAVALKAIYDEIKQLHQEEKKEIEDNHLNFIDQFKQIEKKVSDIVKGKVLTQEQLGDDTQYFVGEEAEDKNKIMVQKASLKNYWLEVLKNSNFKNMISETDEKILPYLQDISTMVTTETFQVTFQFSDSELTTAGSYTRKLTLTNGEPTNFSGNQINFKGPLQKSSFFEYISKDTIEQEPVKVIFGLISELINEIIPYSLQYYMGTCENDQDFGDEDDDGEEDDDEENGEAHKRVKE